MTILETTIPQGLDAQDVRPGARPRILQQFEQICRDQAALHRIITGAHAPNAPGTAAATQHIHDGEHGALIPIPFLQQHVDADLPRGGPGSNPIAWTPLQWQVLHIPPGFETLRVLLFHPQPESAIEFRAAFTTMGGNPEPFYDFRPQAEEDVTSSVNLAGLFVSYCDLTVPGPGTQCIRLDVWDSVEAVGAIGTPGRPGRRLTQWAIIPWVGKPGPVATAALDVTDEDVPTPAVNHIDGKGFTSFDDSMFIDTRAFSSWIAAGCVYNDAYLFEQLFGMPAGSNEDGHANDQSYNGHNHTQTSDAYNSGYPITQHLGAWSYGVGRDQPNKLGHIHIDEAGSGLTPFTGRISAPTPKSLGWKTVAEHLVRIPGATSGNVTGSVTRLKAAAFVYLDFGKAGTCGVRFTLINPDGTGGAPPVVVTVAASGRHTLIANNLEVSTVPGSDGVLQRLRVEIEQSSSSFESYGIYSSCLWFEV